MSLLKNGQILDERYLILSKAGMGGMAEVYEASDIISSKHVAIKLIKEKAMQNPENLKRFENEASINASINHPNIVRVFNNGVINGVPYIVHEFVKGQTLKDLLDMRSALSIKEALLYMSQLTSALYYAHRRGVVHRDVKPDNIFIMIDGTLKLADFGIAQAPDFMDEKKKQKEIIGSIHYLAPEIIKGKEASEKSDIYAAGITFFEMITGHVPFYDTSLYKIALKQVKEKFPSPKMYIPSCPSEIEWLIFKATKKRPNDRFLNAKEFHDYLEELIKNPSLLDEKKPLLTRLFGFK